MIVPGQSESLQGVIDPVQKYKMKQIQVLWVIDVQNSVFFQSNEYACNCSSVAIINVSPVPLDSVGIGNELKSYKEQKLQSNATLITFDCELIARKYGSPFPFHGFLP
jgi:hypothetical protein